MEAAVAGYAQGALESTIGKLGSFLWNETLLLSSVREDIQFVRDELQSMEGFLQDLIDVGQLNNQTKVWMLHVLEVACDAELCIDEFNDALGGRSGNGIVSLTVRAVRFPLTVIPRYNIAKMIQMLKIRAKEVSERRARYTGSNPEQDKQATNSNPTGKALEAYSPLIPYNHLIAEDAMVGIKQDIQMHAEEVDRQEAPSGYGCVVKAIVGPTGSGKTVLAKMLYRRRYELYNQISAAAWVTLPREPKMNLIIRDILSQILDKPYTKIEEDDAENELIEELKKVLQEKSRFLIILDSLNRERDWDYIKDAMPKDGLEYGRVVVTTRAKKVADKCCSGVHLLERLTPLSKDQHNKLVDSLYFDRPSISNSHHQEARPAVNYCCSVPLALKSVCGVLSGAGGDIRTINQFSIEVAAIMVQDFSINDKVNQVVKLCCNYLPAPQMQCLKDISILPEGCIIKRKRLTRRWMAKGLVSTLGGLGKELVVADSYFDELISRSIIEPENVCPSGKIKSCRINGAFKDFISTLSTTPNLDSFQLYEMHPTHLFNKVREKLFSSTKLESLVVLDLEGCNGLGRQDLDDLCKFIQLKLLSLRNSDANHLPDNIGKLSLLETLDIRHTKIEEVPNGILKLLNLKHFLCGYSYKPENESTTYVRNSYPCNVRVPTGMENMSALETLAYINVTKASKLVHVVRYLKNLRKLGLVITEKKLNTRPLGISIMVMSASLRSLSIRDERSGSSLEFLIFLCFPPQLLESLDIMGYLGRLPNWVADHKHLSNLTLSETCLSSEAITLLGKINSLLCLKLYPNSLREHALTLGTGEFLSLRVLIVHCNTIQVISFEKDTAPKLEVFKWVLCKNQMGKVKSIENLSMLKQVSLLGHVSPIISHEINYAVKIHPNRKKALVFENIEREIREKLDEIKTERQGFTSKLKAFSKQTLECFF